MTELLKLIENENELLCNELIMFDSMVNACLVGNKSL